MTVILNIKHCIKMKNNAIRCKNNLTYWRKYMYICTYTYIYSIHIMHSYAFILCADLQPRQEPKKVKIQGYIII